MTRRFWLWLAAGMLTYVIFLCASFPATYAVSWLQHDLPGTRLYDVSGSIWAGQAQQLVLDSVPLGAIHWQFDWRSPWSGKLGYRLLLEDSNMRVSGRVAINRKGSITVRDLAGRLPLQRLDHWLPLPPDSVAGDLQLNLDQLTVAGGLPQLAEGDIALNDASLNWPQSAVLGSYRMHVHTEHGIAGDIQDNGGPLSLKAQVLLQTDGLYQVKGTLSARDPDSAAAHLLTLLGSPAPNGSYPFDFNGHL